MPARAEPELKVSTSLKNLGGFLKIGVTALGALGLGAAGSVITSSSSAEAMQEKLRLLEEASQRYDVRISTAETRVIGLENSYVDIKKDLAEIRGTSTQILFELKKDRDR